jgi:hypothetical protein
MSLTPELVTCAYHLLMAKAVSKAEASKIANLFGSRQEFFAHLVLRERVFESYPAIRQTLDDVAKWSYAATPLFRERPGERAGRRESAALIQSALAKFMAGEKERQSDADALDDAVRKAAQSPEIDVEHFGYHALVRRRGNGRVDPSADSSKPPKAPDIPNVPNVPNAANVPNAPNAPNLPNAPNASP